MHNVTSTPPKNRTVVSTFVNASSLGATAVVTDVTGRSIRVVSAAIVSTLANSVKFQSASTDISALWPLGANGGIVLPYNDHGWCQTAEGEALNINLSVATATGVHIEYIVV